MRARRPAPLLIWPQRAALRQLQAERAVLMARVAVLPPRSHRRIELLGRLRDLTETALAAEHATG